VSAARGPPLAHGRPAPWRPARPVAGCPVLRLRRSLARFSTWSVHSAHGRPRAGQVDIPSYRHRRGGGTLPRYSSMSRPASSDILRACSGGHITYARCRCAAQQYFGGRPRFFGVKAFLQYAQRGRLAIVTSLQPGIWSEFHHDEIRDEIRGKIASFAKPRAPVSLGSSPLAPSQGPHTSPQFASLSAP
jgi:hypothetical protein